ncbi:MAG: PQQ-binding-like beta-propeller repeat protein [Bacteroidetes bacterium]|nr:PQQ-binding-like beta-propeller repeat protein [Bacteroidota bacterium]
MKVLSRRKYFFYVLIGLFLSHCTKMEEKDTPSHWTHFRGSELNGIALKEEVPLTWNDSTNVIWKTPIPGRGWSSPVVFGNKIWMTSEENNGKQLYAVCADLNTGGIEYNLKLFEPDSVYRRHSVNTYATPTPCIEEGFVYVHFGRYGTACLRTEDGTTVWERSDLECKHIQGPGSSPIIHKDKLILHMEGSDIQYIVALNKTNGETLWRTERPKELYDSLEYIGKKAYITPIVLDVNGKHLMISNGSAACIAYDVESGKEVWRIVRGEDSTISMPTEEGGLVYYYTGYIASGVGDRYAELFALDPNGEGDITDTHIVWRIKTPELQLLSPLVKDGILYTIDTEAKMMCLDAKTGESFWEEKLKGKYNSSPVYSNGHLFFSSTKGETIVIKEGREKQIVGTNKLEGEIWASPAVVDNSLLIRTSKFLYRIGEK